MNANVSAMFLSHLSRRINERLRILPDRPLRFLFLDDIIDPDTLPDGSIRGTGLVYNGLRLAQYTVTLHLGARAAAARREGPYALPDLEDDSWLVIRCEDRTMTVTL